MVFSFLARKKQLQMAQLLQRVVDVTTNTLPDDANIRTERRYERFLPVLCTPWENGAPVTSGAVLAHTRDISNRGFGLVVSDDWKGEQILIGFSIEGEPHFVIGTVRGRRSLGGIFTLLGVELTELLDPADHTDLQVLLPVVEGLAAGGRGEAPTG